MVSGNLKIDLVVVHMDDFIINSISLNEKYFYTLKSIFIENIEHPVLKYFFIMFKPIRYPNLLENALVETPGYEWPGLHNGSCLLVKGPCEWDWDSDERNGEPLYIRRNEVLIAFDPIEPEYEVIPLLHFYQVLLLLSEKILEMARQYGTVAYYQKVEPQHYNPNWEQEMERLIGLLRERIAVERERED
jgi:hypothetical protein